MITTGPNGSSSIVFLTGSVVVPATSETMESSCDVNLFTRLDLPALRRPKKAMCVRSILISLNSITRSSVIDCTGDFRTNEARRTFASTTISESEVALSVLDSYESVAENCSCLLVCYVRNVLLY